MSTTARPIRKKHLIVLTVKTSGKKCNRRRKAAGKRFNGESCTGSENRLSGNQRPSGNQPRGLERGRGRSSHVGRRWTGLVSRTPRRGETRGAGHGEKPQTNWGKTVSYWQGQPIRSRGRRTRANTCKGFAHGKLVLQEANSLQNP